MPKLSTAKQDYGAHFCHYTDADQLNGSSLAEKYDVSDGLGFIWSGNPKQHIHIRENGNYTKVGDIKPPKELLEAKGPLECIEVFERICQEWIAIYVLEAASSSAKV